MGTQIDQNPEPYQLGFQIDKHPEPDPLVTWEAKNYIISEALVQKLEMQIDKHPEPYQLGLQIDKHPEPDPLVWLQKDVRMQIQVFHFSQLHSQV